MDVGVVGCGYVGLVSGVCLADVGHQVICVDSDESRIAKLRSGTVPFHEPGLDAMLVHNARQGRLAFSTSLPQAVEQAALLIIAVGTPAAPDGSADVSQVLEVARSIGRRMNRYTVVVAKSTAPPGTGDRIEAAIHEELERRGIEVPFDVVSNPEFMKEGAAVEDFCRPDRILVGTRSARAEGVLRELYAPYQRKSQRLIVMSRRSAELAKYASNAMLACRISLMNEFAALAEALDADIEEVRKGIAADPRIGNAFLFAGTGYGGSCFPKDVTASIRFGEQHDVKLAILPAVNAINEHQKRVLVRMAKQHFGSLANLRIALWGIAFKPNTDDIREAPSRVVMEALWDEGAVVQAYDPLAMDQCRRLYGNRRDLVLTASALDATTGADALFVLTESHIFRAPNLDDLRERMKNPLVFDGRNLFDPQTMAQAGFGHFSVGRKPVLPVGPAAHGWSPTVRRGPDGSSAQQHPPMVALDATPT